MDETVPEQNKLQISKADTYCVNKVYIYWVYCAGITISSFNTIFLFERNIYLAILVKVKL